MGDGFKISECSTYTEQELRAHQFTLQKQLSAINAELERRRGDLIESLGNQLHDIFEKAKIYGIAIEIGTQDMYMSYNPAEDTLTDIHLT